MKTLTFVYTKPDGSVSERTILALTTPSDLYGGIDISNLSPEDGAKFVSEYEALYADFLAAAKDLQEDYDVKYNYRNFKADRMSDVVEI